MRLGEQRGAPPEFGECARVDARAREDGERRANVPRQGVDFGRAVQCCLGVSRGQDAGYA